MAMMNKERNRKGFLMTVLVLVLFTLMIAELLIFTLLNISYNKIQQSSLLVSSSVNYASSLISSSKAFAAASLSRALSALTSYEYNASMRKGNFVSNLSQYLSYLIVNGTLPNVAPNSLAANALAMWMGNATFVAYNASIISNIRPSPLAIRISESKPIIYQASPYNLSVSYVENVSIATPSGTQNYSIPVSASIPLNGTYDLFYAQQGVQRPIRFSSINNLTSVVGSAYATYGNSSSNAFIYGIVLRVPSGVTCTSLSSNVPSWANTAPLNKSIILATPNANLITNATCTIANKFGGLVTYSINSISSPPNIPWLQYSSSTNILNYIPNGTKVLLYGPGMDLLNIEGLRNAVQNGSYFASPFLPSYIDRASANFLRSSPNGIFTFSGSNRYAAQFNGQNSYIETSIVPTSNSMLTVTAWVNPLSSNGNRGIVGQGDLGSDYWELKTFGGNYDFVVYGVKDNAFGPVQLNRWSFLTATYNNGVVNLYVNGVQVASYSESATLVQNKNIYIGYTPGDAAPLYFNGSIANVQIYNTSLSSSQIQQLYQEGIGGLPISNVGLVAWWPLNGNANDYSGNGNNGVATNVEFNHLINYTRDSIYIVPTPNTLPIPGTLSCISGKNCNSALYTSRLPLEVGSKFYTAQFNGQSSYISGSGAYAFPLTAAAWVDPINYQTAHLKTIMEFDGSGFGSGAYQFFIVPQRSGYCGGVGGRLYLWNPSASICTTSTIPLNTWTFVAFTTNSTNIAIYVNGQEIASGGSSFVSASANKIFIIGMQNCCGGRYFNGSLANVQLYNTSLSANEIQALYLEGIGGAPIDLQHLVAWWPLNGNENDYSNNGNNGTAYNVYYTPFYGSYPNNGLSTIAGIINEREALNLVG